MSITIYKDRIEMLKATVPANSVGAEIGVLEGDFSDQILEHVRPRKLFLIDCWEHQKGSGYELDPANVSQPGQDERYRRVCNRFCDQTASGQVEIIRKYFSEIAFEFYRTDRRLDWVYLDANHSQTQCALDLYRCQNLLREGGSIFGHDYCVTPKSIRMGFGVVAAVGEFCSDTGWKLVAITEEEWPSFQLKRA